MYIQAHDISRGCIERVLNKALLRIYGRKSFY